ncbi:MAG: tetratricopeptide repeat protein [Calditerrivibrio sp.]|nr:tetratricopeptide repeat protein [Calditerrivibrio sp.]
MRKVVFCLLGLFFFSTAQVYCKVEAGKIWELADKAYKEKRYKEALQYYQQSLSMCAGDYECLAANYNGLGATHDDLGEYDKAIFYYEKAIETNRRWGNREWLADNLLLAGMVYYKSSSDYEKAYRYLTESKKIFTDLGLKNTLDIVYHELGKAARATGRYNEAITSFNESIKLYREKKDEQSVGATLFQLGITYLLKGQPNDALKYFEESLVISKKYDDHEGVSIVLRAMGDAYVDTFRYERAISQYEEAIKIQRRYNLIKELATTLNNVGTLYSDLSKYEKALEYYNESMKYVKNINDLPLLSSLNNNMGNLYGKMGYLDKAFDYYKNALDIERKLVRPAVLSNILNNIGMEYFRRGQLKEAFKYINESLEIERKLQNPHSLEIRLNNLGAIYLRMKKYKEAEDVFLERRRLEASVRPNKLLHTGLVELYIKTKRYDEAIKLLNETPITPRDGVKKEIEYYIQLGLALKGKGQLQEAAINLMNAINLIEDMRQSLIDREQFFLGGSYYSRLLPYRELVSIMVEMSERGQSVVYGSRFTVKPETYLYEVKTRRSAFNFSTLGSNPKSVAFYFAELTKARTLLEIISNARKQSETVYVPEKLREAEKRLLSDLNFVEGRWTEALKKGDEALKQLMLEKEKIKKLLDELISVYRTNYPRYAALYYPSSVKAEGLPLRDNEVLLEYMLSDDITYLFVVKREGVKEVVRIPIEKETLEDIVKTFMEPLNTKRPELFSIKTAKTLYNLLFSKAVEHVKKGEKIIIVPDGILGLLPFEALVVEEGKSFQDSVFLADRFVISYYQSATILSLNRVLQKKEQPELLFAVGNPIYSAYDPRYVEWKKGNVAKTTLDSRYSFRGVAIKSKLDGELEEQIIDFPPLPETEEEIKEIAKIMGVKMEPPKILLSIFANETNVKKANLQNYKYLHFATHASLPLQIKGVNEPFIILNQVENSLDDGFLTLSEVSAMTLTADMVVLSACVTGVGKEIEGEGVVSFARAFQQAGAKSVVVSLWEVASDVAVDYMKRFYTHIKSGKDRSEAIKLTRSEIKTKYPNPFYWAVFILHGES